MRFGSLILFACLFVCASGVWAQSPSANLAVQAITNAPAPAIVGQNVVITVPVKNNGGSGATSVTVTVVLPSSFTFSTATPAGNCAHNFGTVICAVGSLSTGATSTVTVTAQPTVPTYSATPDYTFDGLDRMTRYLKAGLEWKYIYDGGSERVLKIPPSGTTADYIWTLRDQAGRIVTEYQGTNHSRDNIYLGGLLVGSYASFSVNGSPTWAYYSSDHLGTPRLMTSNQAQAGADPNPDLALTLDLRKYWPYGQEASVTQTMPSQRLRFAGMERDTEANRAYAHARSYDFGAVGRFISVDLLSGNQANPQSLNRFAYALGNPITLADPTGLQPGPPGSESDQSVDTAGGPVFTGEFRDGVFVALQDASSSITAAIASEPSLGESLFPVWGSLREAGAHYQSGRPWEGSLFVALAVTDVIPSKWVAGVLGRLGVRAAKGGGGAVRSVYADGVRVFQGMQPPRSGSGSERLGAAFRSSLGWSQPTYLSGTRVRRGRPSGA